MNWKFWQKSKHRPYPAVYSEWVREFEKLDSTFLDGENAKMLGSGCLEDKAYSKNFFEREFCVFIEKQLNIFFSDFKNDVNKYTDENNSAYLEVVIRRYDLKYKNLFFFKELNFLDSEFKEDITSQLFEKISAFYDVLFEHFKKLDDHSPSLEYLAIIVARLKSNYC